MLWISGNACACRRGLGSCDHAALSFAEHRAWAYGCFDLKGVMMSGQVGDLAELENVLLMDGVPIMVQGPRLPVNVHYVSLVMAHQHGVGNGVQLFLKRGAGFTRTRGTTERGSLASCKHSTRGSLHGQRHLAGQRIMALLISGHRVIEYWL